MFESLFSENGLSLDRLKTFCEVADAGGVTRAARAGNSQPQYSRQLRELETYFGAELFKRKRNSFLPTPAGEKLLAVSKEFMAALDSTRKEIKALPQTLSIGAGDSIFYWLLFPKLTTLNRLFPNYRFDFRNLRTKDIVRYVVESELDFGIVREDACPKELRRKPIGTITYCLFVPHRIAKTFRANAGDKILDGLPLATLEGDGKLKTELLALAQKSQISLNLSVACSSYPLMAEVLKQAEYAAILPHISEADLPSSQYKRYDLNILNQMSRRHVLCCRQRTLDRREHLARQLNAVGDLLQIKKGC